MLAPEASTDGAPPIAAMQTREHFVDGRKVDAKAAVPKDQSGGRMTKKLFVGGVHGISDDDFRAHFGQFGQIEEALVSARRCERRGGGARAPALAAGGKQPAGTQPTRLPVRACRSCGGPTARPRALAS